MAAQQTVIAQLTRFATTLRHKLSPEELAALALTWGELFRSVPDAEFAAACALLLRRCRFFPTPAEAAAALRELRARPRPAPPALPPGRPDPAQLWIAEISGRVCRKSYQNPELQPLAAAYFNAAPGMNEQREQLARRLLKQNFPEFAQFVKNQEEV